MPNVIKLVTEHLRRKRSKVPGPRGVAEGMPRPSPQGFVHEDAHTCQGWQNNTRQRSKDCVVFGGSRRPVERVPWDSNA